MSSRPGSPSAAPSQTWSKTTPLGLQGTCSFASVLLLCTGVILILSWNSCRVVAAILAVLIGISVVGAGIAIYRQFQGKRGSKPAQRVIEIGGLAQGAHGPKSPSYSRSQSGPTSLLFF